jgi:hypothetical protein
MASLPRAGARSVTAVRQITARAKEPPRRALRAAGVPIVSTWIDWSRNHDNTEPTDDEWRRHVEQCVTDVLSADVLLLYCTHDERQFGSLLECGVALGTGKQIFLATPHDWPFLRNHSRVRSFRSLEAAIETLVAMAKGERARNEVLARAAA